MFDATVIVREREDRTRALEARIAELQGLINAAHGELVDIAATIIESELGLGTGVHTPALYLAWKAGISSGHANDIVHIAQRRDELPTCCAALSSGALTVDQAAVIARHVPAAFEADATTVGTLMTVRQLRRSLPRFGFDPHPKPTPVEQERSLASGYDDGGWWLRARLPEDEGAVVATALKAMRDDLYRQRTAELPDGEHAQITGADGLLAIAETALRAGHAAHPGTDRYLVHLHLEQGPNGDEPGILTFRDQFGRTMAPPGATPVAIATDLLHATTQRHVEAEPYEPPLGERTCTWASTSTNDPQHRGAPTNGPTPPTPPAPDPPAPRVEPPALHPASTSRRHRRQVAAKGPRPTRSRR